MKRECEFDFKKLARLVYRNRGSKSLRTVAKETGVSASTLSRVENGLSVDVATFAALCGWLGMPPCEFIRVGDHKHWSMT